MSPKPLLMVSMEGFLITKYHPVIAENQWMWPIEIAEPELVEAIPLFNFELERDSEFHTMEINGITVSTLGGYCGDRLYGLWPDGDKIFGRGYWHTTRYGDELPN